jgi:hypothetical protein
LVPSGISFTTITHSNAQNWSSLLLHDYPFFSEIAMLQSDNALSDAWIPL